jgi:hypothetical protein
MSRRLPRTAAGLCGILGAVALVSSFILNPAPPADFSLAQLRDSRSSIPTASCWAHGFREWARCSSYSSRSRSSIWPVRRINLPGGSHC